MTRQQRFVTIDSFCFEAEKQIGVNQKKDLNYIWTFGNVSCDTCSIYFFSNKNLSDTIQRFMFRLEEGDSPECKIVYDYHLVLFPKTKSEVINYSDCKGEDIYLRAGNKKNIVWKGKGITQTTLPEQKLTIQDSAWILLCYIDKNGCAVTDSFLLFASDKNFSISINPDTTISYGTTATLYTSKGYRYLWQPSFAVNCDTCSTTFAMPKNTTTYTLTVFDTMGCQRTATTTVHVIFPECDSSSIFIPNAFSPNGDKINDVYYVRGRFIENMHLIIYNRWGEKVFESNDLNSGWDGTFKGEELAPDVFGYYAEINCIGGKKYRKKGNVSLLK
jgi:gliding motility-associated-like protein